MHPRHLAPILGVLLLAAAPLDAVARIKLITLPVRERVDVQLDHPELTLVEEERVVPLVEGVNQVDFSWANTRIDPDTIVFRVLPPVEGEGMEVRVLSVSYPPDENALIWSVYAADSGPARVRISYVLGGLDKHFHYRAVAAHDEQSLTLAHYVRIRNDANEVFEQASLWPGFGERFTKPIGLDETKEVLLANYRRVPIEKTYTANPAEHGYLDRPKDKLNVPMHYVIHNDAASGLGEHALPFGKARIFQDDGRGGTAFIGEDWGRFTPIDDEMKLYLGLARDIVVRRTIERNERRRVAGNLYHYDVVIRYEIENFKDSAARLTLAESVRHVRGEIKDHDPRDPQWELGPDTTLGEGPDPEKSDFDKLVFHVDLPPRASSGKAEKQVHTLHLIIRNEW